MNRAEGVATLGSGTILAGKAGDEIAKAPEIINIIDIDVFFGAMAPYGLTLGGLIMLIGFSLTAGVFLINRGK